MNNRVITVLIITVLLTVGCFSSEPEPVVDEAFPFAVPSEAELAEMSAEERTEMAATIMAEAPSDDVEAAATVIAASATVMPNTSMEDDMPEAAAEWRVVGQGEFVGADIVHQGAGTATIFQQGEERILRFEAFSVTNGPDLHVVLSTEANGVSDDYVDLGTLKGNSGNQNYVIPAEINLDEYESVIIYCVAFSFVFATATL